MSDSPPTAKHPAPRPERDEDDSELMKTAPGTDAPPAKVQKPLDAAGPTGQMPLVSAEIVVERTPGMPLLTAAEPEFLGKRGPTISKPELAAAAEKKPEVSPDGLPLLTAARAEALPDPNAPKPAPSAPKPAPSVPRAPGAPTALPPKESLSTPHASLYEQLEAMERAEDEAARNATSAPRLVHVSPGAQRRVEISAPPSGAVPAPAPPAPPPPSDFPAGTLELGASAQSSEPLELDRKGWSAQPERPSAPRPAPRATPSGPRQYQPLELKLAGPPSKSRTAVWAAVVAAGGVAVASAVLSGGLDLESTFAEPEPAPPPAVVTAPVAVAPPPPPAPGSLKLVGVPKKAKVSVDGAELAEPGAVKSLEPGTHQVRVELKGFAPFEEAFDISSGETKELKVALKKAKKKR